MRGAAVAMPRARRKAILHAATAAHAQHACAAGCTQCCARDRMWLTTHSCLHGPCHPPWCSRTSSNCSTTSAVSSSPMPNATSHCMLCIHGVQGSRWACQQRGRARARALRQCVLAPWCPCLPDGESVPPAAGCPAVRGRCAWPGVHARMRQVEGRNLPHPRARPRDVCDRGLRVVLLSLVNHQRVLQPMPRALAAARQAGHVEHGHVLLLGARPNARGNRRAAAERRGAERCGRVGGRHGVPALVVGQKSGLAHRQRPDTAPGWGQTNARGRTRQEHRGAPRWRLRGN